MLKFYVNREQNDLLIVEGERCTLNFAKREIAEGITTVEEQPWVETLDDNQNDDKALPSYREQIANGTLVEVSLDEI